MRTGKMTIRAPLTLPMLRRPTAELSLPTSTREKTGSVIKHPMPLLGSIHPRLKIFERRRRIERIRASTNPLERESEHNGI